MKIHHALLLSAALAFSGVAHGHAHVHKSEPASNSTVSPELKTVTLEFNEGVQISVLTLQKAEEPAQDLKPLPAAAAKVITVPMPTLTPGSYVLKWRATGDDGHVVSGNVPFTVALARKTE